MRIIDDNVRFIMPSNREYQFAAMAIVQAFVNNYDEKMRLNNAMPDVEQRFVLHYEAAMPAEDWEFFQKAGVVLTKMPEPITHVDMELDLTEDKAMSFFGSLRHVVQVYGQMCGINVSSFPQMRTVALASDWKVVFLDNMQVDWHGEGAHYPTVTGEQLLHVRDGDLTCVVGRAGWETYLAAAMGLYVAEIRPPDVPRNWLSKWASPFYYVVDSNHIDLLPKMLRDMEEHHVQRQQLLLEKSEKEKRLAEVVA